MIVMGNIIGFGSIGLGIGAVLFGALPAITGYGAELLPGTSGSILPIVFGLIIGMIIAATGLVWSSNILTQAAMLRVFLDIEANTSSMLNELKRRTQ